MAQATQKKTTKKRTRRTPEQMVADLEAKIAAVKRRAATKQAKQSDEGKAFYDAARALDRAIDASGKAGQKDMQRAAESARAIMSESMIAMGVRLPQPRRGRKRKAQTEEAA